jgi:hypothetical protein
MRPGLRHRGDALSRKTKGGSRAGLEFENPVRYGHLAAAGLNLAAAGGE